MLIKNIDPIDKVGVNLLKENDSNSIIDTIIELPMRKPCNIFRKKGIRTLMSSANKNNVLRPNQRPKEKEDVYDKTILTRLDPPPTFDEAGRGYAWIMLDFDSLSDENKDWLFSLEERKGENGEDIGGKAIWFVHPCEMGNLEYDLRVGKYDEDFLRSCGVPEDQIPKGIEPDAKLIEFEKRHIVLGYGGIYPTQSVFLRMPVNEKTTVEEVEAYFSKFAESFKSQAQEKKKEVVEQEER